MRRRHARSTPGSPRPGHAVEEAFGSEAGAARPMGRLDRYILSQLLRVFGFFALVLIGVYWVNRAVLLVDRYLSEGQSGGLVLELTLLSLPSLMLIVLPIAAFVAAVYVTNRLHGDSELVVVQATGYGMFRLVRPFALFGLLVGLVMLVLAHVLVPASMRQLNALEDELKAAVSSRLLVPGSFQSPTPGITVYVREITPDGTLEDLLLSDRRDRERETIYSAQTARLVRDADGPKLIMFKGMAQTMEDPGTRLFTTRFDDFTVAIGTLIAEPGARRLDYRGLPTAQLLVPSPDTLEQTRRTAPDLQREAHLRVTQALVAAVAGPLGFATLMLGGFSRFGLWRQIGGAVLLIVLVKLVDNSLIGVARRTPGLWSLVYAAPLGAMALCFGLLSLADRPRMGAGRAAA